MLLMEYLSIIGEEITYYAKKATWKSLRAYIYVHSQILIDEYPGYGVQAIIIFKSPCENMIFAGQSRYNRLFQQVVQK